MCVYSMVSDHYIDRWRQIERLRPYEVPNPFPITPYVPPPPPPPGITPEEVEELRDLLRRARKYDEDNKQPDCGLEDKKRLLKELAGKLGVDLGELP